MPRVKALRGDGVGGERVGSGKRAVEGLWDPMKHLNPARVAAGRRKGTEYLMEQKLELDSKEVKSPSWGYTFLEHRKQSADGREHSTEVGIGEQGPERDATWGRQEAPV